MYDPSLGCYILSGRINDAPDDMNSDLWLFDAQKEVENLIFEYILTLLTATFFKFKDTV